MAYAETIDGAVLATLCKEPGPWKVDELRREHGGGPAVVDALARLLERGLAFRMDGDLVVASASGRYAHAVGEIRP